MYASLKDPCQYDYCLSLISDSYLSYCDNPECLLPPDLFQFGMKIILINTTTDRQWLHTTVPYFPKLDINNSLTWTLSR